jgi:hypothetical protein
MYYTAVPVRVPCQSHIQGAPKKNKKCTIVAVYIRFTYGWHSDTVLAYATSHAVAHMVSWQWAFAARFLTLSSLYRYYSYAVSRPATLKQLYLHFRLGT